MSPFLSYLRIIEQINGLGGDASPVKWYFYPGMLFGSQYKWWGDFKYRLTRHEGIDITFFKVKNNAVLHFQPDTLIPLALPGRVINICNDFLGKSLVIEHEDLSSKERRVVSVYAHTDPWDHIKIGDTLDRYETLGQLADTSVQLPEMATHLHLSFIECPETIPVDGLDWDLFTDERKVNLINPVFALN